MATATAKKKANRDKRNPIPAAKLPTVARDPLTVRETQVAFATSHDVSNETVGKWLKISPETVKEHVQNIIRKLEGHGVRSRTGIALWFVGHYDK